VYTAQASKVMLGRGRVFFDRLTSAGASTGLRFLGTVSKLEIATADEVAKIYDYSRADAPLLDQALTRREVTFTLTLQEYSKENLALALMGEESAITQPGLTANDEVLTTSVLKGRTYPTVYRRISGVSAKVSPFTDINEGSDFDVVDTAMGLIHIRDDAPLVANGDTILVTYSFAAIAAPGANRVLAGKTARILGKLVFVADPAAGIAYDCEAWKLSLSPSGAVPFITGEAFGAFDLEASVLPDEVNHPTEPYYRLTQRN